MRLADLAVMAAYLIFITWFGARFRSTQKTLKDYFLGGRGSPWWAISFSIVSAETSTLTVIGTPAIAYAGNFTFLQLVLGYLLGRIIIAWLFLPAYFRGEVVTAYELMERRFGVGVRRLTAGIFLVLRALAEGVRVFAISLVVSVVLGTGELVSIFLIVCLTLFYTFEGGMTAVIWTDVIQMVLYVGGAVLSFVLILQSSPGGLITAWTAAGSKTQIFDFSFSWTAAFFHRPYTFWAGLVGGCFLACASHGTEQLLVQRLLAARSESDSRKALLSSWLVVAFQFTLFLTIGLLLFEYDARTGHRPAGVPESIYPRFIWEHIPVGAAGLMMAAILAAAMSNLSAALNALASTTILDFFKPLRPGLPEASYMRLARWATVGWGAVLLGVGWLARSWGRVLEAGLSIASILYGALLGVFLLGLLTRRPGSRAATAAMGVGLLVTVLLAHGKIAYTWYVLAGSMAAFAAGFALSPLDRDQTPPLGPEVEGRSGKALHA